MFSGSMTALVTPMHSEGDIDEESFQRLIERQIHAGTQALIINGTTAEAPTLTEKERKKMLQLAVTQVNHRIPVIAGTGSYCTRRAIEYSQAAMQAGADACLLITPYYNKPTQEGLYQHYKTIAQKVPIPLILYNAPGRTGCDLLPATVEKLSLISNIVAIKECVMTPDRIEDLLNRCADRISLLTGNDEDALAGILAGFQGVFSVTANIAPRLMQQMCTAALTGKKTEAEQCNQRLMRLHKKLFVESNPIPVKWLLNELNLIPAGIRLPLTPLSEKYHEELRAAFRETGEIV